MTPGFAVRLASVARHITDCAKWPSIYPLYTGNSLTRAQKSTRPLVFR